MGRPTKGFRIRPHPITGIQQVRFTFEGRQREHSTGERDPGSAATEAARIYAEVISGRWNPDAVDALRPGTPLAYTATKWLAAIRSELDATTANTYENYVKNLWAPFFVSLDRITTGRAADYVRARLRVVIRKTVTKELSALRGYVRWCADPEQGYLREAPHIAPPSRKATGTPSEHHRKAEPVPLEPAMVAKILAALPVWSSSDRNPFRVRARFVVAWETGLRPATLDELRNPDDYQRGAKLLRIRNEIDKARFGRELPLTPAARAALDSALEEPGEIFGRHDYRDYLKPAGRAAGLSEAQAKALSPYDFRHARGTQLVELSGNLPGVAWLFGHRKVTTTAKYVHGSLKAAERVLAVGGFQGHSRGTPLRLVKKRGK